ncbi:MAG TPA: tetratricopeptide repeat protein, partial [Vicinamibacterales bacterium]
QAFSSLQTRDTSSEIQRLLGLSYWALEDYPKSLEHLAAAARLNPMDERARLSQADVLVASGNPTGARDVLTAAVAAFPKSGQAQWRLGRLLLDLGDEAGALRAYEEVAGLTPLAGTSAVHAVIGRLQHRKLELDLAASSYERRATLTPNVRDAHMDLGDVYRAQGRTEDALAEYAVAAMLAPTSAAAFAAIGQVRTEMADDEGAVTMLQAAVRLDAGHVEARYALSRALLRLGRADEARRELDAFERLQKAAMEAERRRFDENARAIERTLREGDPRVPVR